MNLQEQKEQNYISTLLTQKEKYFLMMRPILSLNKSMFKSEDLAYLSQHYDPLYLGLKIIQIIIENTTVINFSDISGISREGIYYELKPFLDFVDKKKNNDVNKKHRKIIINRIINTLISTGREMHQMEYIDYENKDSELNWQKFPFRLLFIDTTPDDEVHISVSLELVNIFTNVLDMKVEDKQNAILYMMDQQIKRGDVQSAVKAAEENLKLTIILFKMIQDIIYKTKRKYKTIDWIVKYPKELNLAKDHISLCLRKQEKINDEILRNYDQFNRMNEDAQYMVKELEKKMQKSLDMLLPLQNMVDDARKAFEEKSSQIFELIEPTAFKLDSDFFPMVLELRSCFVDDLLYSTSEYFSNCVFPRIVNLNTTVDTIVQLEERKLSRDLSSRRTNKQKKKRKIVKESERTSDIKYPVSFRKKVIQELLMLIDEIQPGREVLLSVLLKDFRDRGFSFNEQDYLRLLIQGKYACSTFEGRYLKESFTVELSSINFEDEFFKGRDFIIRPIQKTLNKNKSVRGYA